MTSSSTWSEVDKAKTENRRELVVVGPVFKEKVLNDGLDERIYSLNQLNFLDMSGIALKHLSDKVGNLINLTNLVLVANELSELPSEVGNLKKLKLLDVNNNSLKSLPQEVSGLRELQTLNCNNNQLEEFVEVTLLNNLHSLDISHNKLKSLPVGIDSADFTALLTINADDNEIEDLPESLWNIPTLKNLDLSNNKLTTLPANMADCFKLKDFKCTGNNLKDRRLHKLVEQCSTKAMLDYLGNQKKGTQSEGANKASSKKANKKEKLKIEKESELSCQDRNTIKVLKFMEESSVLVKATTPSLATRPYIVCCVIRNINFDKNPSLFKLFINLQTKLHDVNCGKRTTATIASHDLDKVNLPVLYDARAPRSMKITPLNGMKAVTADSMVKKLLKEAEVLRKEKKKSNFGGVHKYLSLVTDKSLYACLVDSEGVVISFPPITNSHETRVTAASKHLLLEVTGASSLEVCKKVMDELVYGIAELGMGTDCVNIPKSVPREIKSEEAKVEDDKIIKEDLVGKLSEDLSNVTTEACVDEKSVVEEANGVNEDLSKSGGDGGVGKDGEKVVVVEQVKVIDEFNKLKVLYPSRTDLANEEFNVVRNFE